MSEANVKLTEDFRDDLEKARKQLKQEKRVIRARCI